MIATIAVKKPEVFQNYLAKTQEVAARYGAELLFRGKSNGSLTKHDSDHGLVVVVRFPSVEKITEWISSDDYQPLIPLRDEGADIKMSSYEIMS
ncbi:MAG: DUF1330 domain-containing protein [Alphaproteobacteria bacterium]|nr:DUF1330 domain-containing protein [Alphaproteobacteria bacterium]